MTVARDTQRGFVGIDIGGTFTDAVFVDRAGRLAHAKTPTTPHDLTEGFFAALRELRGHVDTSRVERVVHGTTVATNLVVQRTGAKVALITTKGFGDTIHMMQGHGYSAGVPDELVTNLQELEKPAPLVPKSLIAEVTERVDSQGNVVVGLNEPETRAQISRLLAKDVDAIAIVFLWSFLNDTHERRVKELVHEVAAESSREVFISLSCDVSPKLGEYARTVATVVNAYVGPGTASYLDDLSERVAEHAPDASLSIIQCTGGVASVRESREYPLRLIGSGPVGGTIACKAFGEIIGERNILAADMGGTSFDVGLVVDGETVRATTAVLDQYEYSVPTVDVKSIGSGGGSIVWVEPLTHSLRVGPASAGADPGPACYSKGGDLPTITDCDVIVGYISPNYFLGGKMALDRGRAVDALKRHIGDPMGMTVMEAAAGALEIVHAQMADLLRQATIGRGHDPRDFVILAFGGAGPTHAGALARELGIKKVYVPCGLFASVWSAYGAASSDAVVVREHSLRRTFPLDAEELRLRYEELEGSARERLTAAGNYPDLEIRFRRYCDLRYGMQVHTLEVPADGVHDAEQVEELEGRFHRIYASVFGDGAGFRAAGVEMTAIRVEARSGLAALSPAALSTAGHEGPPSSIRSVYWSSESGIVETPVIRVEALDTAACVGPAILELPTTTVPIHPGQTAHLDSQTGSVVIEVES